MGGDLNCHHPAWGSTRTSSAGKALLAQLDNSNLVILNDGSRTFITYPDAHNSVLDLSIISSHLLNDTTWTTLSDTGSSDHLPVDIKIKLNSTVITHIHSHQISLRNVSWSSFSNYLTEYTQRPNTRTNINQLTTEEKYIEIISTITEAIRHSTNNKKKSTTIRKIPSTLPWWDSKCDELVRARKQALKTFSHTPTLQNLIILKKTEAKTRRSLNAIKREKFRAFCETLNRNTPINKIWQVVRSFKNRYHANSSPDMSPQNLSTQDRMHCYINTMCPPSTAYHFPDLTQSDKLAIDHPFTMNELEESIQSSNSKTSPGIDQISHLIIKKLPKDFLQLFLEILNELFSNKIFPTECKKFLVILLPKPNSNKFRPISLASCTLKVVERMILHRLNHWLEHQNLLPNSQYGFRKNKSCLDCISLISTDIHNAIAEKGQAACLFLDIESAFDNVIPTILDKILIELRIPERIRFFIFSITSERFLHFKINGSIESQRTVHKGVPQGCILSPLLFNIYTIKLQSHIHPQTHILQFADDTTIISSGKILEECINALQKSTDKLSKHLSLLGLKLSIDKTKLIVFTKKRISRHPNIDIYINNNLVKPSSQVKYLGIYFDSGLTWKPHIQYLIKKANKSISIIKSLRGTWWGGHPSILLMIYNATVRSVIDYSLFTLSIKNKNLITQLNRTQLKALKITSGLRNSTPSNIVLSETGQLSITQRNYMLASKFLIKTYSILNHPLIDKLSTLYTTLKSKNKLSSFKHLPLFIAFKDTLKYKNYIHCSYTALSYRYPINILQNYPTCHTDKGRKIQNSPNPKKEFAYLFDQSNPSTHYIYTDGSKDPQLNLAGYGIYSPSINLAIAKETYLTSHLFIPLKQ